MDKKELIELTRTLLELNNQIYEQYNSRKELGVDGDFYQEVKPFADYVKELTEKWEPLAKEWISYEKPKYIHFMQIQNTVENLQMVSVRAFYPRSSGQRFKSYIQSIDFVLKNCLERLINNEGSNLAK